MTVPGEGNKGLSPLLDKLVQSRWTSKEVRGVIGQKLTWNAGFRPAV